MRSSTSLLQVSAQVLALISQHATNGQCEKTSYDDFYLEVLPDAAKLTASDAWFPPSNVDLHVLGDTGFNALPPILKWGVQVSSGQCPCTCKWLVQNAHIGMSVSVNLACAVCEETCQLPRRHRVCRLCCSSQQNCCFDIPRIADEQHAQMAHSSKAAICRTCADMDLPLELLSLCTVHACVQVACNIRAAVQQELALTMSFGIAVGKLAARLAGPLHKPSGMTVVPPNQAAAFLLDTPILKVPHLRCISSALLCVA